MRWTGLNSGLYSYAVEHYGRTTKKDFLNRRTIIQCESRQRFWYSEVIHRRVRNWEIKYQEIIHQETKWQEFCTEPWYVRELGTKLWSPNCFLIERSCICLSLPTNKATKSLVVSYIPESSLMRDAFDFTCQEIVYQEIMHWDVKRQGTEHLLVNGLIECHRRLALCQNVAPWLCYPLLHTQN